ncbi:MAG: OsmC family protein [Pontimonas sp.]|jgi:putative redox protein|nr:OsmC family protein [Pontimonas sp.]
MAGSCSTIDLASWDSMREAVARDPSVGQGSFTSVTEWQDGALARTTARTFVIETDEPTMVGGSDKGIDPLELILAAIGSCITIGWATRAAQRGIEFDHLTVTVEGDFDLRGFLGVDGDVNPGFSQIRFDVSVSSNADTETLAEIHGASIAGSPVVDTVMRGTPVVGSFSRTG